MSRTFNRVRRCLFLFALHFFSDIKSSCAKAFVLRPFVEIETVNMGAFYGFVQILNSPIGH